MDENLSASMHKLVLVERNSEEINHAINLPIMNLSRVYYTSLSSKKLTCLMVP